MLARLSRELYEPLAAALREEAEIDVGLGRTGHLHLCMTRERGAPGPSGSPATRRSARRGCPSGRATTCDGSSPPSARPPSGRSIFRAAPGSTTSELVRASSGPGSGAASATWLGQPVEALVRAGDRVTGVRARRPRGHRGGAGHPGRRRLERGHRGCAGGAARPARQGTDPRLRQRAGPGASRPLPGRRLRGPTAVRGMPLRRDGRGRRRRSGRDARGARLASGGGVPDRARARRPSLPPRVGRAQAGDRGRPAGGGPLARAPGLLVATGHYRNGILFTPVTAQIIRDYVVEGRSSLPGATILPDRLVRR